MWKLYIWHRQSTKTATTRENFPRCSVFGMAWQKCFYQIQLYSSLTTRRTLIERKERQSDHKVRKFQNCESLDSESLVVFVSSGRRFPNSFLNNLEWASFPIVNANSWANCFALVFSITYAFCNIKRRPKKNNTTKSIQKDNQSRYLSLMNALSKSYARSDFPFSLRKIFNSAWII